MISKNLCDIWYYNYYVHSSSSTFHKSCIVGLTFPDPVKRLWKSNEMIYKILQSAKCKTISHKLRLYKTYITLEGGSVVDMATLQNVRDESR